MGVIAKAGGHALDKHYLADALDQIGFQGASHAAIFPEALRRGAPNMDDERSIIPDLEQVDYDHGSATVRGRRRGLSASNYRLTS